jgi:hypothetical protein
MAISLGSQTPGSVAVSVFRGARSARFLTDYFQARKVTGLAIILTDASLVLLLTDIGNHQHPAIESVMRPRYVFA